MKKDFKVSDHHMLLTINSIGYEVGLYKNLNDLYQNKEAHVECRDYGFDLTDEENENLHTRIIWEIRGADGTISISDLIDLGFHETIGGGMKYSFNSHDFLIIHLNDSKIQSSTLNLSSHKSEFYEERDLNLKTITDVLRIINLFK